MRIELSALFVDATGNTTLVMNFVPIFKKIKLNVSNVIISLENLIKK